MFSSRMVSFHVLVLFAAGLGACGADNSEESEAGSGGYSAHASGGSSSSNTGGGSSGGGDQSGALDCPVDLGVPPTQRLDEITQEQAATLCKNRGAAMLCTYSEAFFCNRTGLALARSEGSDSAETCRTAEAECLREGSGAAEEWLDCSGYIEPSSCPGTVGEYEKCLQDVVKEANKYTKVWSCEEVSEFFLWSETQNALPPESCVGFEECL